MTVDTQFLNTKEVAEILGVHQKTVHNWLRTGKLAGTKISYRAWRIPRSALEEFVVSNSNVRPNALGKDTKMMAIAILTQRSMPFPKRE
jgi:excisionase family DNA binding protein